MSAEQINSPAAIAIFVVLPVFVLAAMVWLAYPMFTRCAARRERNRQVAQRRRQIERHNR